MTPPMILMILSDRSARLLLVNGAILPKGATCDALGLSPPCTFLVVPHPTKEFRDALSTSP